MRNAIDFDKFDEKGLKPLTSMLKKHELEVAKIDATNRAKRDSGFQIKTATLTFMSGQKLALKIKADGDVFQVRLNGKVLPIKNAEDLDVPANFKKAVAEVAGRILANEPTFAKNRIRRMKRLKENDDQAAKKVTKSAAKRLSELKTSFEEMKEESKRLDEDLTAQKSGIGAKQIELSSLNAELEQEEAKNESLRAELAELQEAA